MQRKIVTPCEYHELYRLKSLRAEVARLQTALSAAKETIEPESRTNQDSLVSAKNSEPSLSRSCQLPTASLSERPPGSRRLTHVVAYNDLHSDKISSAVPAHCSTMASSAIVHHDLRDTLQRDHAGDDSSTKVSACSVICKASHDAPLSGMLQRVEGKPA